MRSVDLCTKAGISYRQLDYWVAQGHIFPREGSVSRRDRSFSEEESAVVIMAGSLLKIGLKPASAVEYSRLMVKDGVEAVEVDGWIIGRAETTHEPPDSTVDTVDQV